MSTCEHCGMRTPDGFERPLHHIGCGNGVPSDPLSLADFPASEYLLRPSDPDALRPCNCDQALELQRKHSLLVEMNAACIQDRDIARARLERGLTLLELWNNYHESEGRDPTPHAETAEFLRSDVARERRTLQLRLWDSEERIAGLEQRAISAESVANALRLKLEASEARVRELEAAESLWSANCTGLIEAKAFAESEARALRAELARRGEKPCTHEGVGLPGCETCDPRARLRERP